jgi:hypothetical protein
MMQALSEHAKQKISNRITGVTASYNGKDCVLLLLLMQL